jgi:deoxycytidylate deaminase
LSDFIKQFAKTVDCTVDESSEFLRVKSLIHAGDELRRKFGSGVLAELAIREISVARKVRKDAKESETYEPARFCHIISSVKNQEELDLFRAVYRDMLHCIGVGSPMDFRIASLKLSGMLSKDISELIDQDSGEELSYGQTVRDTFPHSDFFLRADNENTKSMAARLERYLNAIFSTQVVTPTIEESAMFMAASAAANSACLSRQVGAAITDKEGNIVSLGWNDVPKAGGGVYCACDHTADMRCMNVRGGKCQSDTFKKKAAEDIVNALIHENVINETQKKEVTKLIIKSKVKDLIEFSKAIHAEMHAIISGSQKTGARMINGKLFCTTYPCHQCARHIVFAGIKEVYYIEPYRKSLAVSLHQDSITETESETKKVRILPFDGIAPNRYLEVFRSREKSRKEKDGQAVVVSQQEASLKAKMTLESIPILEATVVGNLQKQAGLQ